MQKLTALISAAICLVPFTASAFERELEVFYGNAFDSPPKGLKEMKEEYARAQKKLEKEQAYVYQLEKEIATLEIEQIQKEISQLIKESVVTHELTHEQRLALFCHQREILGGIIRNHPACRHHAQEVLDQILSLITQLSNEG